VRDIKYTKIQSRNFDAIAISILAFAKFYAHMPYLEGSLAITSMDDSPVLSSIAYKFPENFENDYRAQEAASLVWTTSIKWIPALFFEYLNVSPLYFYVIFTFLQHALFMFGVYFLSRAIFNIREIAWLCTLTISIVQPHLVNAGWYGDLQFMPYTTWISLGPILLAWAFLLDGKNRLAIFWFFAGASVNVGMGFTGLILIVISTISQNKENYARYKKIMTQLTIVTSVISLLTFFTLENQMAKNIPIWWRLSSRDSNHFKSWSLNSENITFSSTSAWIIQTLTFLAIIFIYRKEIERKLYLGVLSVISCEIALYSIQAIAYSFEYKVIYSIPLTRVSLLAQIYLMIVTLIVIYKLILKENTSNFRLLEPITIFLSVFLFHPITSIILTAFLYLSNYNKLSLKQKVGIIALWILKFVFLLAIYSGKYFSLPNIEEVKKSNIELTPSNITKALFSFSNLYWIILFIAIFYFVALILLKSDKKINLIMLMLSISLIVSLSLQLYLTNKRNLEFRDWINVQIWARDETKIGSAFVVNKGLNAYDSWGTLSLRKRIILNSKAGYPYIYLETDADFNKKLNFLDLTSELPSVEKQVIGAKIFEAQYFVRSTSENPLNLRRCFQNSKYVVYSVNDFC